MQITRQEKNDNRIDYGVILPVLLLAMIGLASLYVAIYHETNGGSPIKAVIMQLLWYIIGAVATIVIMQFDAEQLWKVAPYAYAGGILLLVGVLFLYDRHVATLTGAKNWFRLGPLSFQPSEVMKPAYILMLGRVVTVHNTQYAKHTLSSDLRLLGILALWTLPIAVLLKLQNDFGTLLVFLAILSGVILVSGMTWKIIAPVVLTAIVLGGGAILLIASDWGQALLLKIGFHSYQFDRVTDWLNPTSNTSNSGYQLWQSMKAIGSGQLTGKGFNASTVTVPVRESDMIFSVIGENFGFLGATLVIMLYFLLIHQMIRVTFETKNEFYAYVSTGVIMMILFHVFENIGMGIGLLPLTGIPLPFISQGGSSLLGNLMGIGFILSMRYHYKSYMFSNDDSF